MANVVETSVIDTRLVVTRLLDVGIKAFAPTYLREIRHARRVEKRLMPLYGRYMFAWIGDGELRAVLKTRGVVGVLRKAGSIEPGEVDDALISLMQNVGACTEFSVDQPVVVRGGRWDGLEGLFSKREEDRITVMLSMLGRKVPYEFHASQVIANPCKM